MTKVKECSKYQLKSFCKYLTYNDKFYNILCSKALIAIKLYYQSFFNKEAEELNFNHVDKAITEGGLGFVSYFLNQSTNIGKIDLDEYIDIHLSKYCSRVNTRERQSLEVLSKDSSLLNKLIKKFSI
jgi:hypothetical protein